MEKTTILDSGEIRKVESDLINGNSQRKKVSVRKIGKYQIQELSNSLLEEFVKLKKTPRNWEIQSEMIKALGILNVKAICPFVEEIVSKNIEEDMITFEAAKAFVRLTRKNINDISKILYLLRIGGHP